MRAVMLRAAFRVVSPWRMPRRAAWGDCSEFVNQTFMMIRLLQIVPRVIFAGK
jgi:hypothetical protein